MDNQFSEILAKKTEVQEYLQHFSKTFQKELSFIEMKVRQDALQMSKLRSYFLVCCHRIKDKSKVISEQQEKLNQPFFKIFQQMIAQERQTYLLELLKMIQSLVKIEKQKLDHKQKHEGDIYIKELREEIIEDLKNIYLDKNINLKRASLSKECFYVRTTCDSVKADKNVRIDFWLLLLIEHINKKEDIQRIDIRNYLLPKKQLENSFTLLSLFDGVVPSRVQLTFSEEEEKNMLEFYLQEVVKMGKIERLVSSYNIELHLFGERVPGVNKKKDIFSNEMLDFKTESEIVFDEEPLEEILSPRIQKKSIKRQQTQRNYYNDMKKTIVDALNQLASKKREQNKKIEEFKTYKTRSKAKKSQRLIEAANNQEAKITRVKHQHSCETVAINDSAEAAILRIGGFQNHAISSPNKAKKEDSFRSEDDASSRGDKQRKIITKKKITKEYHKNMYKELYSERQLKLLNDLGHYHEVDLTKNVWIEPQPKETLPKVRSELQKEQLRDSIRIFQHKTDNNTLKIIIRIVADIKTLLLSLTNFKAWPKWHPNITKIDILSTDIEQNSYDILLKCEKNKVAFECCLKIHFFRVDNRYFLALKSLDNPNEKSKKGSFLNILGFGKKMLDRTYDYLLFTIQTYGSKGNNVEISIDLELSPQTWKLGSQIKLQQTTFFINFYYITSFWKIQWKESEDNTISQKIEHLSIKSLFDLNWRIEYSPFMDTSLPILQRFN